MVLEKRLRQSSPFFIKFGFRLVGDVRLVEVVMCEYWAIKNFQVVSNNDIVPRMLLALFESIVEPLACFHGSSLHGIWFNSLG